MWGWHRSGTQEWVCQVKWGRNVVSSLKKLIPHNAGDNWAFVSMLRFSDHVPSKRYCTLWPFPPSRRSHALPSLCLHIWYSCYIQRVKTPTSPNWIPHTGESSLLVSSVAGKRAPRVQPLTFEYKVILGYRYQRSPSLNLFSLSSFGKLTSAGVLLVQAKHIVLLGIEKVMWMKFDFKIPPVPGP